MYQVTVKGMYGQVLKVFKFSKEPKRSILSKKIDKVCMIYGSNNVSVETIKL